MKEEPAHSGFDYSADDADRLNKMKILRDEDRADLFRISLSLEKEFNVPGLQHDRHAPIKTPLSWKKSQQEGEESCGRCAHQVLVFELWYLMNTSSVVKVIDGKLKAPKDQPKAVDVSDYVVKAAEGLRAFNMLTEKLYDNETLQTMIVEADLEATFPDDFGRYSQLRLLEVLERAEKIRGARGQPKNPDWVAKFLERCRSFWSEHMSGGARPIPHLDHPSKVTDWAVKLYSELHNFGGLRADMAAFETAAKNLTKK